MTLSARTLARPAHRGRARPQVGTGAWTGVDGSLAVMRFLPGRLVVHAGDSVTWTNQDAETPPTRLPRRGAGGGPLGDSRHRHCGTRPRHPRPAPTRRPTRGSSVRACPSGRPSPRRREPRPYRFIVRCTMTWAWRGPSRPASSAELARTGGGGLASGGPPPSRECQSAPPAPAEVRATSVRRRRLPVGVTSAPAASASAKILGPT